MSLREDAIKAIVNGMDAAEAECLGCDCESCRRGAAAGLDALLDWLCDNAWNLWTAPERAPHPYEVLADLLSEEER